MLWRTQRARVRETHSETGAKGGKREREGERERARETRIPSECGGFSVCDVWRTNFLKISEFLVQRFTECCDRALLRTAPCM